MVGIQKICSPEDLKAIEKTIEQIEKSTDGEVAVTLTPRSSKYPDLRFQGMFIGAVLGAIVFKIFEHFQHWNLSPEILILFQIIGACLALIPLLIPSLFVRIIPKERRLSTVQKRAFAHFLERGLHQTENHTGILIYISILERQVELIADKGIHAKVPAGYWKNSTDRISKGIRDGIAREAICTALLEIGETLKTHFPVREKNPNELSNEVTLDPSGE